MPDRIVNNDVTTESNNSGINFLAIIIGLVLIAVLAWAFLAGPFTQPTQNTFNINPPSQSQSQENPGSTNPGSTDPGNTNPDTQPDTP